MEMMRKSILWIRNGSISKAIFIIAGISYVWGSYFIGQKVLEGVTSIAIFILNQNTIKKTNKTEIIKVLTCLS